MRIQIGKYRVHESGSVIGSENEPVDFILEREEKVTRLRMKFEEDKNDSSPSVKAEVWGDDGVQIIFKNFSDNLSFGLPEPLPFGRLNGKNLFLQYRISSFPQGGYLIHYTWLIEEEVTYGK